MHNKKTFFEYYPLALLLIATAILIFFPVFTFDLYWHMANGRAMLETGTIISTEIFSFTANGTSFNNHEWLSQIIFYLFYLAGGAGGLMGLKMLLLLAVVSILFYISRFRGADISVAALVIVAFVMASLFRLTVRPHLFSFLLLSVFLLLLYGYKNEKFGPKALYLIPPLVIVWDFLHGAVYGMILLGAFTSSETVKYFARSYTAGWTGFASMTFNRVKALWIIAGITLVAAFLNPFGLMSYNVFAELLTENILVTTILEYKAPKLADHQIFWFLLFSTGTLLLLEWRRVDLTDIFVLVPFAYLSITYSRAIAPFLIVAAPFIAASATKLLPVKNSEGGKGVLRVLVLSTLSAVVALYILNLKFLTPILETNHTFGYQFGQKYIPVGSARFVKETGLDGNMYNTGHFGGYLAFYLFPERKIFQYNHPYIFGKVADTTRNSTEFEKWNINYAIIGTKWEYDNLFYLPDWAPVYWEPGATTLVRRGKRNEDFIRQYEIKFFRPLMTNEQLAGLARSSQKIFPYIVKETGTYLAYIHDRRLADLLADFLSWDVASSIKLEERIELLKKALRYNSDSHKLKSAMNLLTKGA